MLVYDRTKKITLPERVGRGIYIYSYVVGGKTRRREKKRGMLCTSRSCATPLKNMYAYVVLHNSSADFYRIM